MTQENEYIKLIEILEREKETYENLLEVLYRKQRSVVEGKVDTLRDLIMEEKSISRNCGFLANERVDFLNQFCRERNIKAVDIPLKDFIGFTTGIDKKKLENLRYDLKNVLTEIKKVNRQNETLLHFSINHVRKMTHIFLHSTVEEMNMYSFNGKKYIKEMNQKFVNQQI